MKKKHHKRNQQKTLWAVLFVIGGMFTLTFAAFPLYSVFCKVTGYGGTPQQATAPSARMGIKTFTIRFNADTDPALSWKFHSLQEQVRVKTGENKLIFYQAENLANRAVTGVATFNVTPDQAGVYFHKIHCFCFEKQTLQPHEKTEMPVSFYVDPAIEQDPYLKQLSVITLSYTFFEAKK